MMMAREAASISTLFWISTFEINTRKAREVESSWSVSSPVGRQVRYMAGKRARGLDGSDDQRAKQERTLSLHIPTTSTN